MKTYILKGLSVAALIIATQNVVAATNPGAATTGSGAGLTSTGDFIINAYKQDAIRISGLADINLTPTMGANVSATNANACVFATTNTYSLTLDSANGFQVKHTTAPDVMTYTLTWTDGANVEVFTFGDGKDNFAQTGLISNNQLDELCSTAAKTSINVAIAAAQFTGKAVGTYTDTVTVTIATE